MTWSASVLPLIADEHSAAVTRAALDAWQRYQLWVIARRRRLRAQMMQHEPRRHRGTRGA